VQGPPDIEPVGVGMALIQRIGGRRAAGEGRLCRLGAVQWADRSLFAQSPDKGWLAVSSISRISVWALPGGEPVWSREVDRVGVLAWAPVGRRIAYAAGYSVIVWDLDEDREVARYDGHGNRDAEGLAFDASGERVLSQDYSGALHLWRASTGKRLFKVKAHAGERPSYWSYADAAEVRHLASRLAFVGPDQIVAVGPTAHGLEVWDLKGREALSARRGKYLLATSGAVALLLGGAEHVLYSMPEQQVLLRARARGPALLSGEGRWVAMGDRGEVEVVDRVSGERRTVALPGVLLALLDGERPAGVVARGDLLEVFDLTATRAGASPAGHARIAGFDGRRLVVHDPLGLTALDVDAGTEHTAEVPAPAREWEPSSAVLGATFEPDGPGIVVGCQQALLWWSPPAPPVVHPGPDYTQLWPVRGRFPWALWTTDTDHEQARLTCVHGRTGEVAWELARPDAHPGALLWSSPDGEVLVMRNGEILDAASGVRLAQLESPGWVDGDDEILVSTQVTSGMRWTTAGMESIWSSSGQFTVSDRQGQLVRQLSGHTGEVCRVLLAGAHLVSMNSEGEVKLWRRDGVCLATVALPEVPSHAVWVGDTTLAWTTGTELRLTELSTGRTVARAEMAAEILSLRAGLGRVAISDASGEVDVLQVELEPQAPLPDPLPIEEIRGEPAQLRGPPTQTVPRPVRRLAGPNSTGFDGRSIALDLERRRVAITGAGPVEIFSLDSGAPLPSWTLSHATLARFTRAGTLVATNYGRLVALPDVSIDFGQQQFLDIVPLDGEEVLVIGNRTSVRVTLAPDAAPRKLGKKLVCAAMLADGRLVGGTPSGLLVWEGARPRAVPTGPVSAVAALGERVVTADQGRLAVWDIDRGEIVWEVRRLPVTQMAADGERVAVTDGTRVTVWQGGELVRELQRESVTALALAGDLLVLLGQVGPLEVVDLGVPEAGDVRPITALRGELRGTGIAATDGQVVLEIEAGNLQVRAPEAPTRLLEGPTGNDVVALGADGRGLTAGPGQPGDRVIERWDLREGVRRGVVRHLGSRVTVLAELPDRTVAAGHADGTLAVWDLDKGVPLAHLSLGHGAPVTALLGLPGVLVSGDAEGVLARFCDGRCVARRPGHRGEVTAVAALPSGFASTGLDGTLVLWDAELRWLGAWTCAEPLHSLELSGATLRVGDAAGRVHEVELSL
jgi:WD40 repeat protein